MVAFRKQIYNPKLALGMRYRINKAVARTVPWGGLNFLHINFVLQYQLSTFSQTPMYYWLILNFYNEENPYLTDLRINCLHSIYIILKSFCMRNIIPKIPHPPINLMISF